MITLYLFTLNNVLLQLLLSTVCYFIFLFANDLTAVFFMCRQVSYYCGPLCLMCYTHKQEWLFGLLFLLVKSVCKGKALR